MLFSRFTAEREREFGTSGLLLGAVILGSALGTAAVAASHGGVSVPLSLDAVIIAVLLMISGFTLNTKQGWWTRRPALLIISVVVATTLLVFAVQTHSLRVFDRSREVARPKPIAWIEEMSSPGS